MKHLKAKLMATVMSLLLATLMLTSASFAWFTISTAPEISDITTSVTANGNLEIALDAGNGSAPQPSSTTDAGKNTTWGNLVDLKGYFNPTSNTKNVTLKPVLATADSTTKQISFSYPKFGLDGRISSTASLNRVSVGEQSNANFRDMGGVFAWSDTSAGKTGATVWAVEVDYWLRTNVEGNVALTTATDRDGGQAKEAGLGSWINTDKVTIKIVDTATKTSYIAKPGSKGEDDNYPLTLMTDADNPVATTIPMTASTDTAKNNGVNGEGKLLKMYIYLDGASLTNADFANVLGSMSMNIQFKHNETLTDMDVTQTDYGRATANSTP